MHKSRETVTKEKVALCKQGTGKITKTTVQAGRKITTRINHSNSRKN